MLVNIQRGIRESRFVTLAILYSLPLLVIALFPLKPTDIFLQRWVNVGNGHIHHGICLPFLLEHVLHHSNHIWSASDSGCCGCWMVCGGWLGAKVLSNRFMGVVHTGWCICCVLDLTSDAWCCLTHLHDDAEEVM